jgi:hypothetical protein
LSVEKLRNTKTLPPIADFYSRLTNSTVTAEEYEHARTVYRVFGCENMLEYTGKRRTMRRVT